MSSDGEIMMPVATHDAMNQATILVLRQIAENVAAQTARLEAVTIKVDDVRERLARLEAQDANKAIEAVRAELKGAMARVDLLESQRDKVQGVAAFWNWLARSAPWLMAGIAAFVAGLGIKSGVKP